MKRATTPAHLRVLRRVSTQDPDKCWLWLGALRPNGYGAVNRGRGGEGMVYVHRAVYEALVGEISTGLVLDHLCRIRNCVNPAHLEPVTQGENVMRGASHIAQNPAKTHCPHDHPYDEVNTYVYRGHRQCRTCRDVHRRAHRERVAS